MELHWDGGTKVCSIDLGHMTKMATMPKYGTDWRMLLKFGIQHRALEYYQVCSNDESRLTFDLFTQRSTLVPYICICMGWIAPVLLCSNDDPGLIFV